MDWLTLSLFLIGFVTLIWGADIMVKGASHLAGELKIPPLVIGLTVVAFGSSAPELAINVQSAYDGSPGLAVGNVVGSNIANILLILGISAAITPLVVSSQLLKLDVPLMIGASVLMIVLALDGEFSRWEGLLLFAGVVAYTTFAVVKGRKEGVAAAAEMSAELGLDHLPPPSNKYILGQIGLIVAGLVLLAVGANWLVDGAVMIARMLEVSELIIGLTIVSIGTSLPELATSVTASLHRQTDIAVGNVVGSNLFNILSVLGLSALVAPQGIAVEHTALVFDMPVMLAVAIACLPIFFTDNRIDRWEGWLFLGYYIAYLIYLLLYASGHALLPVFSTAMLWFVLPLTVLTLIVFSWRGWRHRHLKG